MNAIEFVCPKSGQSLQRMTGTALAKLNEACRKKRIMNASGKLSKGPHSAYWIREDATVFYVERQKIPILLVEESVVIQDINDRDLLASILIK